MNKRLKLLQYFSKANAPQLWQKFHRIGAIRKWTFTNQQDYNGSIALKLLCFNARQQSSYLNRQSPIQSTLGHKAFTIFPVTIGWDIPAYVQVPPPRPPRGRWTSSARRGCRRRRCGRGSPKGGGAAAVAAREEQCPTSSLGLAFCK